MRAVFTRSGFWHWCHDGFDTMCGRPLVSLPIERELDFSHLPPDGRICVPCEAARQSGEFVAHRTVLEPSRGYVRKTGSLVHGTKSRHMKQRIWDGGNG